MAEIRVNPQTQLIRSNESCILSFHFSMEDVNVILNEFRTAAEDDLESILSSIEGDAEEWEKLPFSKKIAWLKDDLAANTVLQFALQMAKEQVKTTYDLTETADEWAYSVNIEQTGIEVRFDIPFLQRGKSGGKVVHLDRYR